MKMNIIKKKKEADIYQYSSVLFQIGLIIGMGLLLMAFEWKSNKNNLFFDATEIQILSDIQYELEDKDITYQAFLDSE
jgi:hypothetical protein